MRSTHFSVHLLFLYFISIVNHQYQEENVYMKKRVTCVDTVNYLGISKDNSVVPKWNIVPRHGSEFQIL